jgi:hypothetical protein
MGEREELLWEKTTRRSQQQEGRQKQTVFSKQLTEATVDMVDVSILYRCIYVFAKEMVLRRRVRLGFHRTGIVLQHRVYHKHQKETSTRHRLKYSR